MKKNSLLSSLPFRLIIALVSGTLIGLALSAADGSAVTSVVLHIAVTLEYILGQFINFCVPLIVIGFIAPSIARLGKNASAMLMAALILAYASSFGAALSAAGAGYAILPHLSIASEMEGLKALPPILFELTIPPVMSVMSALVFSILFGLSAAWNQGHAILKLLEEFQEIVLMIVTRFIIPVLPFLIGSTFITMAYEGTITRQLPIFLIVIAIVLVGHYLWLALLYGLAGVYSGHNPLRVLRNYGPAYLTAIGTMSSAAALSVALNCAERSEPPLRDDVVKFGIPLFANIHLCGSVMTETFFVMTVSKMLYGVFPSPAKMILFCLLLSIFAVGAPGVPGGTVMASLGLITSLLGFTDAGTALILTVFALQDSFGTACNITGDGALALILTGFAEKHRVSG